MYIARESSKLWRKIMIEYSVEWPLLVEKWKFILFGLVFQYLHGLAARAVHYLHKPGPVLQDIGFMILPELGPDKAYINRQLSETDNGERASGNGLQLLPLNMREKDIQGKEEHHKLMNGNGASTGDLSSDWRQRMPINGKVIDDGSPKFGSPTLNEIVFNGT